MRRNGRPRASSAIAGFALEDAAPMFEITLTELADAVGVEYGVRT